MSKKLVLMSSYSEQKLTKTEYFSQNPIQTIMECESQDITKISGSSDKRQIPGKDEEFCEVPSRNRDSSDSDSLGTSMPNSGFGFLPDEIWCAILGHLTDTKGLASCYRSCKQLNRILEGQKVLFLFGEIFPFIRIYLKKTEILACRQTSQFWCDGVDRDLNDSNELNPFDIKKNKERYDCIMFTYEDFNDPGRIMNWYRREKIRMPECKGRIQNSSAGVWMQRMDTTRRLQRFSEIFGDAPRERNPFVGRSILVHPFRRFFPLGGVSKSRSRDREQYYYDSTNKRRIENIDEEDYWRHLFPLLTSHGHHVWHLNLMTHSHKHHQFTAQSVFDNLRETLKLLPNLRNLQFYADLPWRHPNLHGILTELLTQGSLPKLKHLRSLCLPSCDYWEPLLTHLVEQSAPTLKRLEMGHIYNFQISRSTLDALSLTELRLDNGSVKDVEHFLSSMSSCRLEALSLTEISFDCHGGNGLSRLIHLISQLFGATLLKLKLTTCSSYNMLEKLERVTSQGPLLFPNLKFLQLRRFRYVSIDLLLELPSLVRFKWSFYLNYDEVPPSETNGEKIDLRMILGRHLREGGNVIYSSNLWTFVPSLQTLVIISGLYDSKTKVFTRKLARTRAQLNIQ